MSSKAIRILFVIALLFACVLMFRISIPYLSFKTNVDFLKTKQGVIHIGSWRWAFYVHVMSSTFVLLLGIFQFLPSVLSRFPKWHRMAGKVYVMLVLLVSGPGGLVMAFYANGGWAARISFIILSLLWLGFTALAYLRVREGKFQSHAEWMVRSFALTLSALSLRSYAYLLPSIILLPPKPAYILIAWLSWIPNLIVGECIIRYKRKKGFNLSSPIPEGVGPKA